MELPVAAVVQPLLGYIQRTAGQSKETFSSLAEVTYSPQWVTGWSGSVSLGLDRGNYLGNSAGGCVTIRKTGRIF